MGKCSPNILLSPPGPLVTSPSCVMSADVRSLSPDLSRLCEAPGGNFTVRSQLTIKLRPGLIMAPVRHTMDTELDDELFGDRGDTSLNFLVYRRTGSVNYTHINGLLFILKSLVSICLFKRSR